MTRYRTIVADPPWPYEQTGAQLADKSGGRNVDGRGANVSSGQRYGVLSLADLAAIAPAAGDDAHLYLWTTNAFMVEAHDLARAWGFQPKTILTWVKTTADGGVSRKTGYYFRGATEHCLFCVKGSLKLQTTEALPTAYLWPRLPHSVKPDAFYDLVEKASPGPYLELFARRARMSFGEHPWDYWGDESLGTAEMPERAA